jgi:hypothetical protein
LGLELCQRHSDTVAGVVKPLKGPKQEIAHGEGKIFDLPTQVEQKCIFDMEKHMVQQKVVGSIPIMVTRLTMSQHDSSNRLPDLFRATGRVAQWIERLPTEYTFCISAPPGAPSRRRGGSAGHELVA